MFQGLRIELPRLALCAKRCLDLRTSGAMRRPRFFDALPGRLASQVTPLEGNDHRDNADIALCSKITGPFVDRIETRLVVVPLGVSDGVLHRGMFAQTEYMDVHRGAVEPFAQSGDERFVVALAEFRDDLGNAARAR